VTGWARDFTRSGNSDVNDYLTYFDRVRDDSAAVFNVAEIITLINLQHMRPDRYEETLKVLRTASRSFIPSRASKSAGHDRSRTPRKIPWVVLGRRQQSRSCVAFH
jgi:hypothetical protein